MSSTSLRRSNRLFFAWKGEIEKIVIDVINLKLSDLPDQLYRDMYDECYSPDDVAAIIIREFKEFTAFLF